MYIAVLSADQRRAKRLGDQILDACMQNGCYSTFLSYSANTEFLRELDRRQFNTVVITADSADELQLAHTISQRQPGIKLILLGDQQTAVEGYSLNADYCAKAEPQHEELKHIARIIFPAVTMQKGK